MTATTTRDIYNVSRLNAEIRAVLENGFPLVWVEGEISNLVTPRSGHSYFSLKDAHAQVRCALFRNRRRLLRFEPRDGDKVLARARVSLYEARGEFQLIIEHLEPAGEGALLRAFQELKARLEREGLFGAARKQPLPPFPRCVGVITSPTGAAVRDILQIMARRNPAVPVLIYPSRVQGNQAPAELTETLRLADARGDCDLLILARGGGSLEDLAAFNDEALARTIAALRTPIISAVGHETDFTIADFVADRRAPTPSAAAELATPDRTRLQERLTTLERRLNQQLRHRLAQQRSRLNHVAHKLQLLHPGHRLEQQAQRLDELERRLISAMHNHLSQRRHRLQLLAGRLARHTPGRRLERLETRLNERYRRLEAAMTQSLAARRERLKRLARTLQAVSPLQTLARGYSITTDADRGVLITDARQVQPGQRLHTRLQHGGVLSRVERIETEDEGASLQPG